MSRIAGTSLAVQWLRFCASNARGAVSIPGWGTKLPRATVARRKPCELWPVFVSGAWKDRSRWARGAEALQCASATSRGQQLLRAC